MINAKLRDAAKFFNCVIQEPAAEYHAQSRQYLTSHKLGDFRRCPRLYHRKRLGLIADIDRAAYLVGRAGHAMVLEGRAAFLESFAVGGPVNPKTGLPYGSSTKAWAEWAEAQGKSVLTHEQHELVMHMNESVHSHPAARELLSEGMPEGVVRTHYCDMPCQIRMDWLAPEHLCDLKTTDTIDYFESDARRYGYLHQVAFYQSVFEQRTQVRLPVFFIAVEKREPFRTGVWHISDDALAYARRENEAAIARLKSCEARDDWPTGYEEIRVYDAI